MLFKIKRQCADNNIIALYYDCKLSSIYCLGGDELLDRICGEIAIATDQQIGVWASKKMAADRFVSLIENLPAERQLCLIFDEIEYISPSSKLAKHWADHFVPFWQTIWSAQSQHRKFAFTIAGVNASVMEQDRVNGIQNPMFGIVKTRYLTGFEKDEVRTLLSVFGKRMGMRFDESSLNALFERYGGHPLLTRMICSQINNGLKVSGATRPVAVTSETVAHDLQSREDEVQFYCGHITSELEEFYPKEFFMLETLASGNTTEFNNLSSEIDYIRHLKAYGLVDFSKPYTKAPGV